MLLPRGELCPSSRASPPAQELLVGFCGRVVSSHSRSGAARPAAKGSKQAWGVKGGGGELAEQRGRSPGPCEFLAGVLRPERGPCCLPGEEEWQGVIWKKV